MIRIGPLGSWIAALALVACLFAPKAVAQPAPLTARSAVPALNNLKQTFEIRNFRLGGKYDLDRRVEWENGGQGGISLESLGAAPLRTAYIAVGTPRRDAKGEIINAIVINSYYSGDSTNVYAGWYAGQSGNAFSGGALIGPGLLFDTNRFYVVMVDALGLWGASKPSDGLGRKFPAYNYYDMVQANYRLLRDHLKVGKVVLATGVSMGGTQSYYWGLMHPGFVQAVMPIGGASATDGDAPIAAWAFQLAKAGIEADPHWVETQGDYYKLPKDKHPSKGVEFHWSMLSLTGYELAHRQSLGWGAVQRDEFSWQNDPRMGAEQGANLKRLAGSFDAVDLWYRASVGESHNLNALLPRMATRTMVVHIENDQWLIADKARAAAQAIPGGQYVSRRDPIAHYAVFSAPNKLKDDSAFDTFVRDIGLVKDAGFVCEAKNYRTPRVNPKPDPSKSFWKDEMVSPFPVKYAKVKDRRGVEWEIGYMDEYCGVEKNPKTLVVVHGKGAFGAHYGYLIKYAVEHGYRVIAPDMPHFGTSGPGNIDKPMARTLDDVRDAFHALVVGKLGVKKAWYHGHSLGGQAVLGYALRYPAAVQGLILEGPAGLEEFPRTFKLGDDERPICDKSYAHDIKRWHEVWDPFKLVDGELKRDEQSVRDFFYFKTRDAKTGAVSPSTSGYFKRDTEYARLHTDQRVAMISGNRRELEQWSLAFIYDVYSICSELTRGDKDNLLQRIAAIKVPIFAAFGAREPFIPSTPLNGLTDLARDVITPFKQRMTAAGNAPVVKVYPGVGHFIHTDVPYEFARDTVDFMRTGRVDSLTPAVVDALVNGATADVAAATGGGARPSGLSK